eukprot:gb/GECG01008423.1/.p1 GENE.gb/GECG01008423.1/~~gb/GECG01008423.1/.p1  ORF type:complete len:244 (+),score=8.11 gb/GECG01008423.1/:1-732(+)
MKRLHDPWLNPMKCHGKLIKNSTPIPLPLLTEFSCRADLAKRRLCVEDAIPGQNQRRLHWKSMPESEEDKPPQICNSQSKASPSYLTVDANDKHCHWHHVEPEKAHPDAPLDLQSPDRGILYLEETHTQKYRALSASQYQPRSGLHSSRVPLPSDPGTNAGTKWRSKELHHYRNFNSQNAGVISERPTPNFNKHGYRGAINSHRFNRFCIDSTMRTPASDRRSQRFEPPSSDRRVRSYFLQHT